MLGRSFKLCVSTNARGIDFLRNRFTNKSTAFTRKEREHLGVVGLLPPAEETLDDHVKRCWTQLTHLEYPINKYQLLQGILSTNTVLYYKIVETYMKETLPIIYTPTVGEACQKYGNIFQRDHGLYISMKERGVIRQTLENLRKPEVEVIVITDGSRILGLGDLGANGMGISIGKCSLYVAAGGINPSRILPVMMDVGTDNEGLRADPQYLGLRQKRPSDEDFYALLDEFMEAASEAWPEAVIQFEDFSNNHCFDMLERYQNKYRCFNDDIQGTGAVIAAGFLNAIEASGIPAEDHRIVFFGAGSAATGVATCIVDLVAAKYKKTFAEVQNNVYLLDTKGVITTTRGDKLAPHKVPWARTDISAEQSKSLSTLVDAVKFVKPTALIGLGAQGGVFTEDILKFMRSYCEKPVIFALSNPSSKVEVTPDNAFKWTDGKAIVATGSPFPPTTLNGKKYEASQGNNLYVFPGIGLGCAIAQPKNIPQEVLQTAAVTLSKLVDRNVMASEGALYPCIDEVREVSKQVAAAVIEKLQEMGLAKEGLPTSKEERLKLVEERMWTPKYLEPEYYLSKKLE
ncbi:malic enzyme, putative [Trypanosoma brucei gambiense DAL972]|uniref:Malic enzyme n=1 Tax=Trypanosoma brucei gambiense (strain MHOM/CI/86/DAL972) TaxID=679716 RepID=D0A746_TRYB9|nr:malic enzyme, putative [Trypanosoma brucei gambiense DAL972]CBH17497.1 malic enzyme, putative [Trypanosoma brucei gambiense DAL972]|eukprot:XP_011779761.1 malic enzyme, putative [Trypanosoma brucei gambiense DAL972]